MTLLNTANDGLPSVLITLTKAVLSEEELPREKLIDITAPSSVTDGQQVKQTLNTWEKLGLFDCDDEHNVSICDEFHTTDRADCDGLSFLRKFSRNLALADQNNPDLWAKKEALSADFTRALTWCMAQDVYRLPGGKYEELANFEVRQFPGDKRALQNATRWRGFKKWAIFFEFGWLSKFPNSRTNTLVIDPTVPVRNALPAVFQDQNELSHDVFLQRLASTLPVVDGGEHRNEMEAVIKGNSWSPPRNHELSTSLSRALERLHIENEIKLENRADASKATLLGRHGEELREISHIIWLEK